MTGLNFDRYKSFNINNIQDLKLNKYSIVYYRKPNPPDPTKFGVWSFVRSKHIIKYYEGVLRDISKQHLIFDNIIISIEEFSKAYQYLPWAEYELKRLYNIDLQ